MKSAITRARRRRRSASAPAESTTISRTSATRAGTIRFSRCSATSASAITSRAEAIDFAWELLTKDYGLPKDKLYVTVFREDDEAEELWQKVAGVPKSRIFRLDEKDNFWQMGETGPCGPCSEIHFDYGPAAAEPGREHEQFPDDGGGRFVEIWNLVFMQFDRSAEGVLTPLPAPVDRYRHGPGAHRRSPAGQAQ